MLSKNKIKFAQFKTTFKSSVKKVLLEIRCQMDAIRDQSLGIRIFRERFFFLSHIYARRCQKNLFTNFHFQLEIKLEFVKKNNNDNSKNFVTFQLKMTQRGAHIKAILGNLKLTSLNLIPLIEPKLEVVGGKDLSRGVNRTREGARCCK